MKWNENDTKYIIKRLILYFLITGIVFFAGAKCAKAYSMVGYNADGGSNVTYTNDPPGLGGNPWFIDYGLYASTGNISGRYLTIVADMSMNITSNVGYGNYIGSARDTLKASNLRCGIGSNFKSGYDSTYSPTVDNFNVYYSRNTSTGVSTIRVTFIYKQQRTFRNYSSTNYSCWFERSPSDGLYAQGFSSAQWPVYIDFTGYDVSFSLSEDPNTALLQEQNRLIETQNQLQQQEINATNNVNNNIINTYNYLGEDFSFNSDMFEALGLFEDDSNILRSIIMFPFNIMVIVSNAIQSDSCSPYTLGTLYGTELVLPCINYKSIIGNTLYALIDTIFAVLLISGFVVYLRHLITYVLQIGLKGYELVNVEVFK